MTQTLTSRKWYYTIFFCRYTVIEGVLGVLKVSGGGRDELTVIYLVSLVVNLCKLSISIVSPSLLLLRRYVRGSVRQTIIRIFACAGDHSSYLSPFVEIARWNASPAAAFTQDDILCDHAWQAVTIWPNIEHRSFSDFRRDPQSSVQPQGDIPSPSRIRAKPEVSLTPCNQKIGGEARPGSTWSYDSTPWSRGYMDIISKETNT